MLFREICNANFDEKLDVSFSDVSRNPIQQFLVLKLTYNKIDSLPPTLYQTDLMKGKIGKFKSFTWGLCF